MSELPTKTSNFTPTNIFLTVIIILALGILCWAPWLNNQKLHDQVLESYRPKQDGTINKDGSGSLLCDYKVEWAPFGRGVGSCEGGYYVTFWGMIL